MGRDSLLWGYEALLYFWIDRGRSGRFPSSLVPLQNADTAHSSESCDCEKPRNACASTSLEFSRFVFLFFLIIFIDYLMNLPFEPNFNY